MGRQIKVPMTSWREKLEREKLSAAIRRWCRVGGSYDRIIATADAIYATKVAAVLDKLLPKKQKK